VFIDEGRAEVNLMISRHFEVDAPRTTAMHAEPVTALDALKLASLAVTRP
jgi:hypothetical protein